MKLEPETRSRFIERANDFLYKPVTHRMAKELSSIITENSELHGNNQPCFMYKGELYSTLKFIRFPVNINPLHRDVRPRFKTWLANQKDISDERHSITCYILAAINLAPYPEAMKQMMPDSFTTVIERERFSLLHGTCPVSDTEIQAFIQSREQNYLLMKQRLTMNLLERN